MENSTNVINCIYTCGCCLVVSHLSTQGLALDEGGCGISRNPTNQRREQTPVSMITQSSLQSMKNSKKKTKTERPPNIAAN